MAARLRCELDPWGRVLRLRPFRSESSGRAVSRTARLPDLSTSVAVSATLRTRESLRGIPACLTSPEGPCVLRFTCADSRRCMEAAMIGLVPALLARQLGFGTWQPELWTLRLRDLLLVEWEEEGLTPRLCTYLVTGCAHKTLHTR
nr:X protein [Domestic cat hepadnavirus]